MTLDEAIKRYNDNAEYERTHGNLQGHLEFRQLAEWLRDYKRLKEQEPCEDAISRQAVMDYIHRILNQGTGKKKSFEFIQKYVEKLPSVKPQVQIGHWIRITNGGAMKQIYLCSVCHRQIEDDGIESLITIKYPYCHCGAKMSESEVSNEDSN